MRLTTFYNFVTNRILISAGFFLLFSSLSAPALHAQVPQLPGGGQQQSQPQQSVPVQSPQDPPPPPGSTQPYNAQQNNTITTDGGESLQLVEEGLTEEDIESQIREDAFDAALQGLLPLQPLEIRKLLERFDRTQESVEVPVYPNPKPEVTVETLSLDPGSAPATIKVAYGHVTTLNMVDLSGEPWPIEDISWAGNFDVIEAGAQEGSHILRISPETEFAQGNISIRMLDLKTPIIMSIETSRDIVHYRFDAIVPKYGPFAQTPLIQGNGTTSINSGGGKGRELASMLAGMMPANAEKLHVTSDGMGGDGRTSAYRINGLTYVRTPLTLLSPGWNSSAASADGMRVYEIKDTPVLLLSDNGKMVRMKLTVREDILE